MKQTVLVIEEFEILRAQLDEMLTSAGYRVRLAKTLAEGLSQAQQQRFQAVLLDVACVPAGAPSDIDFEPETPVLLTTTKAHRERAEVILRDHAVSCIDKPFQEREVLSKLARALQCNQAGQERENRSPLFGSASAIEEYKEALTNPIRDDSNQHDTPLGSGHGRIDIATLHLALDRASEARAAFLRCLQAREKNNRISCDDQWRSLEDARENLELELDSYIDRRIDLASSVTKLFTNNMLGKDHKALTDASDAAQPSPWLYPDVSHGIDLEAEVCRYEIGLIKRALELTGGHQSRAAGLLRMNPTTLNSKIKKYRIRID